MSDPFETLTKRLHQITNALFDHGEKHQEASKRMDDLDYRCDVLDEEFSGLLIKGVVETLSPLTLRTQMSGDIITPNFSLVDSSTLAVGEMVLVARHKDLIAVLGRIWEAT